jgi:thiamine biosynthesis lipoprotein
MRLQFSAIGTEWDIDLPTVAEEILGIKEKIIRRIDAFDKHYSRFRTDSLVTRMAQSAGEYVLPKDAKPLLDIYQEVYGITHGLVTPLIGQVLVDAGYDPEYSLTSKTLRVPPAWDDVLEYNFPTLTLLQPALLDFGAAGKGYLVDIIADLLDSEGIGHYVINVGGDIRCTVPINEPCIIGLEDPSDPKRVIGTVEINSGSICGSAGNRRAWKGFHHIINPKTLQSPENINAVWVRAAEARIADVLTTCLYLLSPEEIMPKISNFAEFLIMYADNTFQQSENFDAILFK